jgi:hypothetical protein
MNLKDFYAKAILLPDGEAMIVKYTISKTNIGKIQLSNSIKLFDKKKTDKLQKLLRIIEDYAEDYYYIPIQKP